MDPRSVFKKIVLVGLPLAYLPLFSILWAVLADHYPRRMDSTGMALDIFDTVTGFHQSILVVYRPLINFLLGIPIVAAFGTKYYVVSGIINTGLALVFALSLHRIFKWYFEREISAILVLFISSLPAIVFEVTVFETELALISFSTLFLACVLELQKNKGTIIYILIGLTAALAFMSRPVEAVITIFFFTLPLFSFPGAAQKIWISFLTGLALILPWGLFFRRNLIAWISAGVGQNDLWGHLWIRGPTFGAFAESYFKEFVGIGLISILSLGLIFVLSSRIRVIEHVRQNKWVLGPLFLLAVVYPFVLVAATGARSPVYFYTSLVALHVLVLICLSPLIVRFKKYFLSSLVLLVSFFTYHSISTATWNFKLHGKWNEAFNFRFVHLPEISGDHFQREVAERVNNLLKPTEEIHVQGLVAIAEPPAIPWFDSFGLNVASYDLNIPIRWTKFRNIFTAQGEAHVFHGTDRGKPRYFLIGPKERMIQISAWLPDEQRAVADLWLKRREIRGHRHINEFQLLGNDGSIWSYDLFEKTASDPKR